MEDVVGEMMLILHPRQGVLLHSLRFEKPSQVSSQVSGHVQDFGASGGTPKALPSWPLEGSGEAVVAHQLRRAMRYLMNSAR